MLNQLNNIQCEIIVNSKSGKKTITTDLKSYIKIQSYENIVAFFKRNKREIIRSCVSRGYEPISVSELFHNQNLFKKMAEIHLIKEYSLDFESLFEPFYFICSYKKNKPVALINHQNAESLNYTDLIQLFLNQYGYIDDTPKYQLKSIINLPYKEII